MKRIETKSGLIAFLALLLVLCTMLGVLFTQGRYVKNAESGSEIYGSDMNFIVSEQIEVNNVEEFIAAVENGYSNIKISDEVENPLIITSGVTDVGADLILDLNGHEIQRNNREPMLNIVDGVRMTIIDSSRTQAGAFYNPVGSVLQIGGGTLTVTAGAFVSGPKKSEYAQQRGSTWTAGENGGTGGTIAGSVTATLYTRDTSGGGGYTPTENASVPKITPTTVSDTQTGKYVNGNMYFDEGTAPSGYSDLLREDTYLYYVVDDAAFNTSSILADTNTADFYYTYEDGGATVTVYGYHYVKETAQNNGAPVGTPADPDNSFAAIRMSGGNMYVRGGSYTTNFGCGTAYGLFATGGYMAVETGSFVAIEEGVCIECNYSAPSDEDYLRVSGGTFSSQNGDTVRVYSGKMVVTGGSFVKNSTRIASDGETPSAGMTSAVHVKGGTLTASNAAFLLSGSAQYGIYSEDDKDESGTVRSGTVSLTNVSIQFVEDTSADADDDNRDVSVSHNYGVYAAADITLNGDCTVDVSGAWSGGLLAQGGDITYGNTRPGTLNVTMRMDTGKTSLSSSAIAAVDGKITFNGNENSQVNVVSDGIGVAVRQETSSQAETEKRGIELTAGSMNITTTRATALYVSGGSATFNSGTSVTVNSTIDGSCTVPVTDENGNVRTGNMYHGVFVQGGSLNASGATLNVTHRGIENDTKYSTFYDFVVKSYAVRVEGAQGGNNTVTITQGAITSVEEVQNGGYLGGGGGLYVSGGTVTLGDQKGGANGLLTIEALGSQVTGGMTSDSETSNSTWHYRKNRNGGHAVEVSGGTLNIWYGTYTAKMGNGILVSDGTANIHSGAFQGGDTYTNDDNEGKPPAGPAASYAFKMYGGTANISGGTFTGSSSGAFVMGTTATAKANITAASIEVNGTAGFAVYRNATVTFGTANNTTDNSSIRISGESAAITVEDTPSVSSSGSSVTIYSGTYWCNKPKDDGGSDGIFYGEETTSLTIYGGIFSGIGDVNFSAGPHTTGRSGLYIANTPAAGTIQLYGGTFYGQDNELYQNWGWRNRTANNAIYCAGSNTSYANILGRNENNVVIASATGYVQVNGDTDFYENAYSGSASVALTGSDVNTSTSARPGWVSVDYYYPKVVISS